MARTKPSAAAALQQIGKSITQRHAGKDVRVLGFADSRGDKDYNRELSEKRAEVIVKELVARGVSRSEIIAVGRGSEQMLVKPDDTAAKKAKNRRYEIQVRL